MLGEIFLHVARDIDRFQGDDAALRRWVFSIARNRLIDDRRRRARRPVAAERDAPEHPAPDDPPAALDPSLLAALGELTADQREVVVLRFVADLSLDDVARLTRRRVGAVKAMQHRALEQLSRILGAAPDAYSGDD